MPIVGFLATCASLLIAVLGLPAQILRNYRNKSGDGLAPSLTYSAFLTYTLWSIYGWTKPDLFLAISNTPGSIATMILLFQLFYYRRKAKAHKS